MTAVVLNKKMATGKPMAILYMDSFDPKLVSE